MEGVRQTSGSPPQPHCPPVVSDEKHHEKWKSHSHKTKIIHSLILPDVKSITLFIFLKPFFFLSKSQNYEAWTKIEKTKENELLSGRIGQGWEVSIYPECTLP